MRLSLAAVLGALLLAGGCAGRGAPAAPPAPDVSARLSGADALVRIGCFDCLEEALGEYDAVRTLANLRPADLEAATTGAIRSALLLELRQRELGMADDGFRQRAEELIGGRADLRAAFAPHLYTIDSIPRRLARFNPATGPDALQRMQQLRASFPALLEERRAAADGDPLSAYSWLAFYCTHTGSREDRSIATLHGPLAQQRDTPIVAYRTATCLGPEVEPLTALLEHQPRYVEITHWLAESALGRTQIEEAERLFTIAFKWRPRWPAVTAALGNVLFAFEEHERALDFFDRTLALAPEHPEALIGRIKALSLLGRSKEAFAAIDALLAGETRVSPGEAFYWRAWNFTQISDLDMAWVAIEEANKLWVNSEVLKLGGIIAYRRLQRPAARERFEAAYKLVPEDCETSYLLGNVHAELRDWPLTSTVFARTATCIESARDGLRKEIAAIEASTWEADRKKRQIARREAQIAGAARMLVTSWFNIAVSNFNLGSRDEARRYAERVADDEQFAERARDILKRLQ
jgi:tetratricopeptide (TPR) repeat protein